MSLSRSCVLFKLCRQGIYQQQQRDNSRKESMNRVKEMVLDLRRQMPRIGTRKIYFLIKSELNNMGIKLGRDGLFSVLQEEQLLIRPRRNYRKTTWSKHWMKKHPNTFKSLTLYRVEQAWVSDITYIPSQQGTFYLSLITDAFSRKIVGYNLSPDLRTEGVLQALKMAIKSRKTSLPLLHHSDRGVQYCSMPYQKLLKSNNIKTSMTEGIQDCYQNALAERMNGILKEEFLPEQPVDIQVIERIINQPIETYNNKRPHLSLNYRTPSYLHQQTT